MIHVIPPPQTTLDRQTPEQAKAEWAQRLQDVNPDRWTRFGGYESNSIQGTDYFALISEYDGALGTGRIRAELHAPQFEWDTRHNRFKIEPSHALWTLTLTGGMVACRLEVGRVHAIPTLYRKLTWAYGLPRERFAASIWTNLGDLERVYNLGTKIPDQWDTWARPKPEGMHCPFLQWLIELPYGPNPEFNYDTYYPTWLARARAEETKAAVPA